MTRPASSPASTAPATPDRNLANVLTPTRVHWLSLGQAETAVRAAYAAKINLVEVPKRLRPLMDARANKLTQAASAEFLTVYGEMVQAGTPQRATDPCEATCVATPDQRGAFLTQMSGPFWSALRRLNEEAGSWHRAWAESAHLTKNIRPTSKTTDAVPGLSNPPVHAVVTAAQEVTDALAGAMKGFGQSTALTLVREARAAKNLLKHAGLPGALGLETIDDVLDALKLKIPRSAAVFEDALVAYTRAAVELSALEGIAPPIKIAELAVMGATLDWRHFS